MRRDNQPSVVEIAPSAEEPLAVLQEVDRSFPFMSPSWPYDGAGSIIDQYEGARLQDREHAIVLKTYVSIAILGNIKLSQQKQR